MILEKYFYGEVESRCVCKIHRNCKRGGDVRNALGDVFGNPRFQGSMQAIGGLAEASFGGGMTLVTSGAAAPFGWPVMAHGLDHFFTGMATAFTGRQ